MSEMYQGEQKTISLSDGEWMMVKAAILEAAAYAAKNNSDSTGEYRKILNEIHNKIHNQT